MKPWKQNRIKSSHIRCQQFFHQFFSCHYTKNILLETFYRIIGFIGISLHLKPIHIVLKINKLTKISLNSIKTSDSEQFWSKTWKSYELWLWYTVHVNQLRISDNETNDTYVWVVWVVTYLWLISYKIKTNPFKHSNHWFTEKKCTFVHLFVIKYLSESNYSMLLW
jgi:hypothetical protein